MTEALIHTEAEITEAYNPADRRAWVRHNVNLGGNCGRITDGMEPRLPARVQDISAGGIALILKRVFQPGTVLVVKLQTRNSGAPSVLFARVVHSKQLNRMDWVTGCTFATPLDEDELKALIS